VGGFKGLVTRGEFGLIDYTSPETFLDPQSTVSFTVEIRVADEKNCKDDF